MTCLEVIELPFQRELTLAVGLHLFHLARIIINKIGIYGFVDGLLTGQLSTDTHDISLPVDFLIGLHLGRKGRSCFHGHLIRGIVGIN